MKQDQGDAKREEEGWSSAVERDMYEVESVRSADESDSDQYDHHWQTEGLCDRYGDQAGGEHNANCAERFFDFHSCSVVAGIP